MRLAGRSRVGVHIADLDLPHDLELSLSVSVEERARTTSFSSIIHHVVAFVDFCAAEADGRSAEEGLLRVGQQGRPVGVHWTGADGYVILVLTEGRAPCAWLTDGCRL